MKILSVTLEFTLYLVLLCLLGAPFVLIVCFPNEAEHFTKVGETFIPWGVILLLSAMFSNGIKSFIAKLISTLDRVKSVTAVGSKVELHAQEIDGLHLTSEQAQQARDHMQALTKQSQENFDLASHFFLKYVVTTIYGSQFKFLEALESSELSPNQAVSFYNEFLSKAPPSEDYNFNGWLEYLNANFLAWFDSASGSYVITQAGRNFIAQAKKANYTSAAFSY